MKKEYYTPKTKVTVVEPYTLLAASLNYSDENPDNDEVY